jgi:hypothetical protein
MLQTGLDPTSRLPVRRPVDPIDLVAVLAELRHQTFCSRSALTLPHPQQPFAATPRNSELALQPLDLVLEFRNSQVHANWRYGSGDAMFDHR